MLVTPRWISWHLFAVCAVIGMMWLGDWQFRRAMAGNTLSWAYTFEWPIFAIFGVFFWFKTVRDELHPDAGRKPRPQVVLPAGTRQPDTAGTVLATGPADDDQSAESEDAEPVDPELAEYNAYLARLNKEVKSHGRWHGLR
ncbi:MAG: hypothetical protein M0030_15540 [Actinomycetota bacterium]|nr:hypothetical protein [Actinomycetota bacterium]